MDSASLPALHEQDNPDPPLFDAMSSNEPGDKSLSPHTMVIEIRVPHISDTDEYEFLPGHFKVRKVIEELDENSYLVKLRSGETEKVTAAQLETLEDGPEALARFENSEETYSSSSSPEVMEISSSEDLASSRSHLPANGRRRQGRSTRSRNTQFTTFFDGINSDGESVSNASSDDIISSKAPRRRGLRTRPSHRYRSGTSETDGDFLPQPRGTRSSNRQRKSLRKSLRERFEDDISDNDEGSSKDAKFSGAREVFIRIPKNDPFRLQHSESCEVCHIQGDDYSGKGPLVFCQGCTSAFHRSCLGPRSTRDHLVTKVADNLFLLQCRRCIGVNHSKDKANPHQGYCAACNVAGKMSKPLRERWTPKQEQQLRQENDGKDPVTHVDSSRINNTDNVLVRCTNCHRAFHTEHFLSPNSLCTDCSSAPGEISTMVAWRPIDPKYVTATNALPEHQKEYLIKWRNQSYQSATWMPGTWVCGVVKGQMRRAFERSDKSSAPRMTIEEAVPESYMRIDIVFDVRYNDNDADESDDSDERQSHDEELARIDQVSKVYVKFKGLIYEESVWEDPPSPSETERWNDFEAAYRDFMRRDHVSTPNTASLDKHLALVRKQNFQSKLAKDTQPSIMTGGEMMDYQKDGMNWLYYMWYKRQNAILADEMGLGKTIQVIGFFAALIQDHKCWPFLVVVPNSTCPNWRKEIKHWAPSIRVVTYYGSAFARKLSQEYEMFAGGSDLRCHVVVTSYETMVDDASRRVLTGVPWRGLVVDEGQRLKNDKSQLYEALSRIKFPFKALLTGTPLQNNTRELFNLLQFCDPTQKAEALEHQYGVLSKDNIPELHDLIRPFFLRRTKTQVLTFLPPMAQIIVPVSMTVVQKKLYKSILAKNPSLIKAIFQRNDPKGLKQAERHNLNNMLMQLRKCLCHPFVYSDAIEERTDNTAVSFRHLVDAAGKFKLLELMLPKLHQRGNRVLIFSQFLDNLDIIEDFLDGLGLRHRRLDGRMNSLEKQKMIDDYNADGSPYFAFLLSTRSGGVGINLATADTVIIMDPDFNPHQDMQALSRAHRIGQKNKVLVFQLMTRGSAEEKIVQIGKKKMVLDHVLIDRMISEEDDGQDLESILRHGAQALFNDDESGDVQYDSESVDKLLDRSQAEQARSLDDAESQFSFARVWANDNLDKNIQSAEEDSGHDTSSAVWEKILQEREQAAAEEARRKAETLGRGKRKRATITYESNDISPSKAPRVQGPDSDDDFQADEALESDSDSIPSIDPDSLGLDLGEEEPPVKKRSKVKAFQRVHADADLLSPQPPPASMDGQAEHRPTCLACGQPHPQGSCRLKMAGVEHCGLCGLAHFGHARTCSHLRSSTQVFHMLQALKHSKEDPKLVEEARKYLRGIRGSLSQRERKLAANAAVIPTAALQPTGGAGTPGTRTPRLLEDSGSTGTPSAMRNSGPSGTPGAGRSSTSAGALSAVMNPSASGPQATRQPVIDLTRPEQQPMEETDFQRLREAVEQMEPHSRYPNPFF